MKRANEYGTKVTCDSSQASSAIQKAFISAQKAARAGDVKGIEAAKEVFKKEMSAVFVQAIITYAHEMYLDRAANVSSSEHQVRGRRLGGGGRWRRWGQE